jgi:hypothetical protein
LRNFRVGQNSISGSRNDEQVSRLRLVGTETVRQLRQQLDTSITDLVRLRNSVVALRDGIGNLSRHLQVRIETNSSLGVLHFVRWEPMRAYRNGYL